MIRYALPLVALVSLFWLPFEVTWVCIFASAIAFPLSGLALGIISDVLYYPPHLSGIPWGIVCGGIFTLLSLLVHRYVKTRIMEA